MIGRGVIRASALVACSIGCSSPVVATYPRPRNPAAVVLPVGRDTARRCIEGARYIALSTDLDMLLLSAPRDAPPPYDKSEPAFRIAHTNALPVGDSDVYTRDKRGLQYTAAFGIDVNGDEHSAHLSAKAIDFRVITGESIAPLSHAGSTYDWSQVPATSLEEYCIISAVAKCAGVTLPGFHVPSGASVEAWQSKSACRLLSSEGEPVRAGGPSR